MGENKNVIAREIFIYRVFTYVKNKKGPKNKCRYSVHMRYEQVDTLLKLWSHAIKNIATKNHRW